MEFLPVAALGAVIASAAFDLFDTAELRRLWRMGHAEFLFALIAMLGVIGFGVLRGILIAIVTTVVYLLARVSRPSDALLGRIPGQDGFYKLHREPRAKTVPGLAVYLVQSSLVFFNIEYVRDRIRWIVDRLPQSTRWFILDAQAVTTIDSTAAAVLAEISEELSGRNLRFWGGEPARAAAGAADPIWANRSDRLWNAIHACRGRRSRLQKDVGRR
jgi:MFS superfamily sulfate permease-like transporter